MAGAPRLPQAVVDVDCDGALAEAAQAVRPTRRGLLRSVASGAVLGVLGRSAAARPATGTQQDINILKYALGP